MYVWLTGPTDFDDFKFVYNTLSFLSEESASNATNGWTLLSYEKNIFDSMAEWYAMEKNLPIEYSQRKPDCVVIFSNNDKYFLDMHAYLKQSGVLVHLIPIPE